MGWVSNEPAGGRNRSQMSVSGSDESLIVTWSSNGFQLSVLVLRSAVFLPRSI